MGYDEWIEIATLKLLLRHASVNIAALILFATVGYIGHLVIPLGPIRIILDFVEEFVLVGLILFFAYQTALLLWKGRVRNVSERCFLVA